MLDLAAIMLMSLHWPGDAWRVGQQIAEKFFVSRAGRGRSRTHGQTARDVQAVARFRGVAALPRGYHGRYVTRSVANAVMRDAADAFFSVWLALLPVYRQGIVGGQMRADSVALADAFTHADTILHYLLRRLGEPWRTTEVGRPCSESPLTWEAVQATRAGLERRTGKPASDRQIARELQHSMMSLYGPKVRTLCNAISRLRREHAPETLRKALRRNVQGRRVRTPALPPQSHPWRTPRSAGSNSTTS